MELFALGMLRPKNSSAAAEASAQQAQRSAEHLETELQRMEERVEKLSVLMAGMWELLKEKTGVSDDELKQIVSKVETQRQQDSQQFTCPQCGRAMLARDRRCLYCEYRIPDNDPFSPV
jgi:predicted RNA-binding Zn-ribbon protein involved in translation (DUF1610 family)